MRSDIRSLYPSIYRGVRETDALARAEDIQFNRYFRQMDQAREDQFIYTAGIHGIEGYERLYGIVPDPASETLEFRRLRVISRMRLRQPFTMRFLRGRLDEIVGEGRYRLRLDHDAYTLYVEAVAGDVGWYQEVHVMMGRIKPANLVFVFTPLIIRELRAGEVVSYPKFRWMYRLGSWPLGRDPFAVL